MSLVINKSGQLVINKDDILYKDSDCKTLDVDEKSRRVKNAFNKIGVKDSDKDIIDENAYTKTIRERGPEGKNLIWHLTDHRPYTSNAVSKFSELYVDKSSGYLVGVTDIPKTTLGNDIFEHYRLGNINQHSIGFTAEKRDVFNADDYTNYYSIIRELKLYEGSTVLWGANEYTPNLSVGKSSLNDIESEIEKYFKEFDKLTRSLKDGKFTDDTFELLEYRLKQLQTTGRTIFNHYKNFTEPETKDSVQPDAVMKELAFTRNRLLSLNAKI